MLGYFAAIAAASLQPVATEADLSQDPDLRCMVAMSLAIDGLEDDSSVTAEEKSGIISIFMYYLGRIDARLPGIDYVKEVSRLVENPNYLRSHLRPDLLRCSAEAQQRGKALQEMGEALQKRVPIAETRPG